MNEKYEHIKHIFTNTHVKSLSNWYKFRYINNLFIWKGQTLPQSSSNDASMVPLNKDDDLVAASQANSSIYHVI